LEGREKGGRRDVRKEESNLRREIPAAALCYEVK